MLSGRHAFSQWLQRLEGEARYSISSSLAARRRWPRPRASGGRLRLHNCVHIHVRPVAVSGVLLLPWLLLPSWRPCVTAVWRLPRPRRRAIIAQGRATRRHPRALALMRQCRERTRSVMCALHCTTCRHEGTKMHRKSSHVTAHMGLCMTFTHSFIMCWCQGQKRWVQQFWTSRRQDQCTIDRVAVGPDS